MSLWHVTNHKLYSGLIQALRCLLWELIFRSKKMAIHICEKIIGLGILQ